MSAIGIELFSSVINHPIKRSRLPPATVTSLPGFLSQTQEQRGRKKRACAAAAVAAAYMGNCQAAEAATVVIQHPGGGRTERAYWALSAAAVMAANPGHYVAAVITSPPTASSGAAAPVKHLKLLRPDDTLMLGRVYRLVSFEEVLREFASKRQVKLSRVTIKAKEEDAKPARPRRRRGSSSGVLPEESHRSLARVMRQSDEPEPAGTSSVPNPPESDHADAASEPGDCDLEALLPHGVVLGRRVARQWRPALQSIAEG